MKPAELIVRRALPEDRVAFFAWYEQSERWSFLKREPKVPRDKHLRWFDSLLRSDPRDTVYVGVLDTIRVGAVRFKWRVGDVFDATLVIRSTYLASGVFPALLAKGAKIHRIVWPNAIVKCVIPLPRVTSSREYTLSLMEENKLLIESLSDSNVVIRI